MDLNTTQKITVWVVPIIFAITIHEVAHGWVASKFGDQTARLSGRLTLNPVKHIDIIGTIIVPLFFLMLGGFVFGWAKPVPVDARNLRNPRVDMALVAAAGPLTNIIMALMWAAFAKLGMALLGAQIWFGVFFAYMGAAGIIINVVLAILNCLPVPPLDGGRILVSLLPGRLSWHFMRLESVVFLILIALMISGWLWAIIGPPISFSIEFIATLFDLPFALFKAVS